MTYAAHLVNTPYAQAREAYVDAWREIDAQGLRHPVGRQLHVAWIVEDVLHVVDVWNSREEQDSFMRDLMPIIDRFKMEIVQPVESGELLQIVLGPTLPTSTAPSGG
jgi:hypothetical protein